MKDSVVILFSPGSYGTYLEWCLTTLTSGYSASSPFTELGNSHMFCGNHLVNISRWSEYVQSNRNLKFCRLHPKSAQTDSLRNSINLVADEVFRVIYLYPSPEHILLVINNLFYKIWDDWLTHSFATDISIDKIYNNWPVERGTPVDQINRWIMREFLSYYLMPCWFDQVEWHNKDHWSRPNVLKITTYELLFEFDKTLNQIQKFCNLEYHIPVTSLQSFHDQNLRLQTYLTQDSICNQIINAIVTNCDFDWAPLTLPSESWIQWELRNRGFEIRCDGLDTFPTNSIQLRELLYPI